MTRLDAALHYAAKLASPDAVKLPWIAPPETTHEPDFWFWGFVDKSSECWVWNGSKNRFGYGKITINKCGFMAHRLSYLLFCGDIPSHMCVLHHCDNPSCVRPDHLWLGTRTDNNLDRDRKGRHHKGPRGPYKRR